MAQELNVDIKVTGLADLKTQLKAARDEVIALQNAEVIDADKITEATKRAGALKDALNDANEQIAVMSGGSDFEKISSGIGLVSSQIQNMDFEGAAKSAKNLTNAIKGMDPKSLGKEFGEFTKTIGQLSNAFVQMGLKLLANPLFLLVAVVVAVVVAIVMLKDKLKIAEIAFDLMMKPIKLLIQGLKDLTDWIGITSFAEDEAAEKSIAASEKRIEANKKVGDSMAKEYGRQIALAKANGEDTNQLEIKAAKDQQQRSYENVNTLNNDIQTLRNKQKDKTIAEKEEISKQIAEKRKQRDEELQINKDSANSIKIINATTQKEAEDEAEKANEKRKQKSQKAEADRIDRLKRVLEVERALNQSNIAIMEEGIEKDLAMSAEKRRIQEEDLQFTKYTETQKATLRKIYKQEEEQENKKSMEKEKARLDAENKMKKDAMAKEIADMEANQANIRRLNQQYSDYLLEHTGTDIEKKKAVIQKAADDATANEWVRYYKELANINLTQAEKERLEKEHQKRLKRIKGIATDESNKADDEQKGIELAKTIDKYTKIAEKAKEGLDAINGFLNQKDSERLSEIDSKHNAEIKSLDDKQQKELSASNLTEAQKRRINEKYEKLKYESDLKAFKDSEKIKKQQFARDKALRMVGVVIDTAKAVSGAVAASPLTFGMPWAAVAGAIGAIQLATIASQKYQGEAGPAAPSIGNAGGGGAGSSETGPALALYGKQSDQNTTKQGQSVDGNNKNIMVTAVVSETDVTDTQDRVGRMRSNAEL